MTPQCRRILKKETGLLAVSSLLVMMKSDGPIKKHRNPSRYRQGEYDMLNWMKATRKKMNAGKLKKERVELFQKLLEMVEKYKRVNQYR